jgi:hypothetical protein
VTEIDGPPLTPTTARQLGAALIAAADETDEMAGCDQIEAADDPALTGIPLRDLIEAALGASGHARRLRVRSACPSTSSRRLPRWPPTLPKP